MQQTREKSRIGLKMLNPDRPDAYDKGFQDGYLGNPLSTAQADYLNGYQDGVSERIQDEMEDPTDPGWEPDEWETLTPCPISNEGEL
jgi:hypothetical protein